MRDMTAALIIENKKFLLVHNTKYNGERIEPPGGKKEDNETLKECVIREVREELGIIIEPNELFGVYETLSPEGGFVVYMYLSSIKEGRPKIMEGDKVSKYGWYSYEDILKFREQGVLVPNLCSALDKLKRYI